MSMPILATKLFVPPPRANWVRRRRLIERLKEGLERKLTLISASAGFGKTTILSEWIAECDRPVAWLSLDDGDNELPRFLAHLVAALLKGADNRSEEGMLRGLQSLQSSPTESIPTLLLNEISGWPAPMVLVLDDYHVIHAKPVDDVLRFLLEHLPPQLHLVIATREDPQLPLGRLRARGHLTELRAADLRFTPEEAADFLGQVMGLALSRDEVIALEARTEGWIAGLQLAALSMQGREDVPQFVRAFAGDNRYIVDYLVEEVLQRQSDQVREFLLRTSILDRLHGPLCDAVTEQADSAARLQFLERGNFFVVALDDNRGWYRYHHLFSEVLSAHLRAESPPDQVAMLHRRASLWYERHGFPADAIRHASAAGDFARAADLIERACPAMAREGQMAALLQWLKPIPDDLVRRRPVLSVWYAGALLASGNTGDVEQRLQDAERGAGTEADAEGEADASSTGRVVSDEAELRRLPGSIAMYRAGLALVLGDVPAVVKYARQVLSLVSPDDHLRRGAAAALLGLASWRSGDLEEAYRGFADGIASVRLAGNIADAMNGSVALAEIRTAQGRLRDAMRMYERGLQLAEERGEPKLRGTADVYVGMSELYREMGDFDRAERCLRRSREQGEHTGFPHHRYRWRVAMSRMRESQGDLDGALALLREAERLYVNDFFVDTRPIGALKARLHAAQGRWREAFDWARERELSVDDDLSYLREFEHVTLARIVLARSKSEPAGGSPLDAIRLLKRLLQAAEAGGRTGSAIEIRVVSALAYQRQGDLPAALATLEKALRAAEPEGFVRIFADEGPPMATLLEAAAKRGIVPEYARRLLTAIGKAKAAPTVDPRTSEPLSERERDVLRLLRTELSGPDIARELMVSLNTLRTHTKHIHDKLGVNSRRAAVRRAEELGLF